MGLSSMFTWHYCTIVILVVQKPFLGKASCCQVSSQFILIPMGQTANMGTLKEQKIIEVLQQLLSVNLSHTVNDVYCNEKVS